MISLYEPLLLAYMNMGLSLEMQGGEVVVDTRAADLINKDIEQLLALNTNSSKEDVPPTADPNQQSQQISRQGLYDRALQVYRHGARLCETVAIGDLTNRFLDKFRIREAQVLDKLGLGTGFAANSINSVQSEEATVQVMSNEAKINE